MKLPSAFRRSPFKQIAMKPPEAFALCDTLPESYPAFGLIAFCMSKQLPGLQKERHSYLIVKGKSDITRFEHSETKIPANKLIPAMKFRHLSKFSSEKLSSTAGNNPPNLTIPDD